MTDKALGTAAGDIFAKAFTLGYETGRKYVPAGGMALTAEQVEDVRTVVGDSGITQIDQRRDDEAMDRLRALFPATKPAEGVPARCTESIGLRGTIATCELEEGHGGRHFASDEPPLPTPAEPAEEETKAEVGGDFIEIVFDGPPEAVSGRFVEVENPQGASISVGEWIDRGDGFWALRIPYASSPVVPATTETGPWQRIEDVPESVYLIKDCEGDKWRRDRKSWEVYSERGFRWHPGFPDRFAPFVAAEEG